MRANAPFLVFAAVALISSHTSTSAQPGLGPALPGIQDRLDSMEQIRPREELLPEPELKPDEKKPEIKLPPVEPLERDSTLSIGPSFFLREVRFSGNTVVTDEELRAVATEYVDTEVSVVQLQALRRKLTLYYVNRGYINSGALLPDQDVRDGIIEYRMVEGKLSEIQVQGNKRLRSGYITERIALGSGPPLNVNELQEGIQIMLEDPQIERMDVSLEPGTLPGQSALVVDVREDKFFDFRLTFDNYRAPSIGELQLGVHMRFQNFSGWGDALSFTHYHTEGLSDTIARFEVPVTARDTKLFLRVERSEADVVEGFGSEIDVESESTDYQFGVTRPFYRRVGRSLIGSLSLNPRTSTTFLLGRPFSFSPGVQNGKSKVAPLRIGLSWLDRDRKQVIALRSTFSIGLDILDATENSGSLPDGDYFAWLAQFQWVRRLNERGDQIIVRADGQLTPDSLLPLEKFTVGGPLSVRGYLQNQLVRDNGYSASVEGRIPLFRLPIPGLSKGSRDGIVELAPFVDLGGGWNTNGPTPDPRFISSIGVGLRWRVSADVRGNIYYAEALNNAPQPAENSLQSNGISFELVANFF